jgi:methyl-accepting chemotaxis protein
MRFAASFVIVGKHEKLQELMNIEAITRQAANILRRQYERSFKVLKLSCEVIPFEIGEKLCKVVALIVLLIFQIFVIAAEITNQVITKRLGDESVEPTAFKDMTYRIASIYENLIPIDRWNAEALTTINQNIMNQHTKIRDHLQDRHQLMVNDIIDVFEIVRNEIGNQIAESNASLGEGCARTNRELTTRVDPSPSEMSIGEVRELWTEEVDKLEEIEAKMGVIRDRMEGIEARIELINTALEASKTKMEGIESMLRRITYMLQDT